MEPYTFHYLRHPRSDDSMDLSIRLVLNEFQRMDTWLGEIQLMEGQLNEKISGFCSTLEKQVVDIE
jgi:hypothetical protein